MLPPLYELTDAKRRRRALPSCHDELRYEDGETVNVDKHTRVEGGDAKFTRTGNVNIPYGEELTAKEQLEDLNDYFEASFTTVRDELYSNREPEQSVGKRTKQADEAYVETYDNKEKLQYYLLTVRKRTTLVHIQRGGEFWDGREGLRADPKVGDACFTNGILWTNPAPDWAWKSDPYKRTVRVRIDIPPKTQVVMDRAPVWGGFECQFDDDRTSLVPDVLLGPAEFKVIEVLHYRSSEKDYTNSKEESKTFKYVEPNDRGSVESDEGYAQRRVFDSNGEFMDVRVELVRQVKLPPVG